MRNSKRATAGLLCVFMVFALLPAAAVSAAGPFYRAVAPAVNLSSTTAPDGQQAYRLTNIGDGTRITNSNPSSGTNLADCENMYMVFDVYTNGAEMPASGNFAITRQGASTGWWGQDAHFFGISKGATGSTWMTFSVHLSLANALANNVQPADLSILTSVRSLGFSANLNGLSEIYIRNLRFQDNPYSTPAPVLVSKTQNSLEVKAEPRIAQDIDFAISAVNSVVGLTWVNGIKNGDMYTYEFTGLDEGKKYYVFARTAPNEIYNFTGTAYSGIFETEAGDQKAVDLASEALDWNVIKNANTAQNAVTTDLTLPKTGANGVVISWMTDAPEFVSETGAVTRPQNGRNGPHAYVKLTAVISRNGAFNTKVFDLTVLSDETDLDVVNDAAAALGWNNIKSTNTSQNAVTAGLSLPLTGASGVSITWSSSDISVINDGTGFGDGMGAGFRGFVNRPLGFGSVSVTLTATLRRGAASVQVPFYLIVPGAAPTNPATASIEFLGANLYDHTASGLRVSASSDDPAKGATMTSYSSVWYAKNNQYIYFWIDEPGIKSASKIRMTIELYNTSSNFNHYVEYASTYPGSDNGTSFHLYHGKDIVPGNAVGTVTNSNNRRTITVELDRCNFNIPAQQNQGAQFRIHERNTPYIHKITLTAVEPTNEEAVAVAKAALTWDVVKGENTLQSAVTKNLNLINTGELSANIEWQSSNPEIITSAGTVTRPDKDANVTLTAKISRAFTGDGYGAPASDFQTFIIGVRGSGADMSDGEAVAAVKAALTWDLIKSGNFEQNKVTTKLNLPTMGAGAADIEWTSSDTGVISDSGAVVRDADLDKNVTLTAKIRRGEASDTVKFDLTVAALSNLAASIRPAVQTVFPTKDWVVSDFNVRDFGARTTEQDPTFDNRPAFQAAIDAAYNDGGGVVWIPAGNYAFRSENNSGIVLDLKQSVTLRGDWISPEDNGGKVEGTILEVYAGRGKALMTSTLRPNGAFITMTQGTGVTNLSVWYPEQDIDDIQVYPWTFYQTGGNSATLENVTLVNPYCGFYAAPAELHYLFNTYITALNTGVEIHTCTDIGRIEKVKIDPKYWAGSGLPGSPSLEGLTAWTSSDRGTVTASATNSAAGFKMHRSDWEYLADLYISGYYCGMWIGREPSQLDANQYSPNAQLYRMHIENCGTALYIDNVNGYGLLISDSVFGASGNGARAAYFSSSFNTSVQFNGVDFTGPVISDGSGGVISFESCTFDYSGGYDITLNRGSMLLGQSEFKTPDRHVYLGRSGSSSINTFKSVNSGNGGALDYYNYTTGSPTISVVFNSEYDIEPIPRDIQTNIAVQPKADSGIVLRAELACAKGFNNDRPEVDVSARLQAMLDAVAAAGGGIVYLPGGRYLVDNPIVIPYGVELRGTRDVQSHISGGGSAIFTNYGIGRPDLPPLIQLKENSGIRGLHIVQLGQREGSIGTNAGDFLECPFFIQGQGADVYAINLTMPNADKFIDLASYKTDRHYVEYLGGSAARAGIWVGGGADGGFIRNMQGNPHYGQRFPTGMQGYPSLDLGNYQREHYSALKFGDVTNETIFNNFVFGSRNGIHFLKDEVNGRYPGELTVVGHGTDGSTYGLFVEDADENTKIVMINSELVTITATREKSYVLMGSREAPEKVDPKARLVLYNTACWGGANIGAIVNNGTVRFQQVNFQNWTGSGGTGQQCCIQVNGGSAHVYNSYFQQNRRHLYIYSNAKGAELTNNFYTGGMQQVSQSPDYVYGSDISSQKDAFTIELIYGTDGISRQLKLTRSARGPALGGTLGMLAPEYYASIFAPVTFGPLDYNESIILDMPYYTGFDSFVFEAKSTSGRVAQADLNICIPGSFEQEEYFAMLVSSAKSAIEKAVLSKSDTDMIMAENFIALVSGETIKDELFMLLYTKRVTSANELATALSDGSLTKILIAGDFTVNENICIPKDMTVIVKHDAKLRIEGAALNFGTIINYGEIDLYGVIENKYHIVNIGEINGAGKIINEGIHPIGGKINLGGGVVRIPLSANAAAYVNKLTGNKNELVITVTETYFDNSKKTIIKSFTINNNAANTYQVDNYKIYVDTKGNTQIREIYIVSVSEPAPEI